MKNESVHTSCPVRQTEIPLLIPIVLVFALVLAWASSTGAQNSRGTILGHIQDASGAPIGGVKVTVLNAATGVTNQFETVDAGDYVFVDLVPGSYNITAEKDDFKTAASSGLILEIDQTLRQNFTLQVGSITQEVTVGADTQMVQTDNTTLGNVLDEQLIQGLPSNGRDFTNLLNLSGGATNLSGGIQTAEHKA